jgi:hypothetical protein
LQRTGGFDVVLGNPPWESIKLQEQEFFAAAPAQRPPIEPPAIVIFKGRAIPHDDPRASNTCLSIRSARCAPEKAGRPSMMKVGTPFRVPSDSAG